MNDIEARDERPLELSAAAQREWIRNVESVMRGVAHALNNRAAALSAVIELCKDDDGPEATRSILGTELQRVRELSGVVRSLGTPRAGVEAFSPRDAAAEAQAILGLHADQRDRAVLIEASPSAAVRVPRWMFVRALVAMAGSVPIRGAVTHSLRIIVGEDGDWVHVRAEGVDGTLRGASPYTAELVHGMAGELLADAYGFRLSSLVALRKHEGR